MKTITKLLLAMSIAFIFSCQDNDIDYNGNNPLSGYDKGNTVTRDFVGIILDTSGNPVSGATVTIGASNAQTSTNGTFIIKGASVKEKFAYIKVTKSGFIDGMRTLIPTTGENRVNIMMIPIIPTQIIVAGTSSVVSLSNGTSVKFDGAFKDENGSAYSGNVTVSLYHLETSKTYLNELMPGNLLASNAQNDAKVLETFGMLHVDLRGSSGQKLNIANGHTAEISLEIDPSQASVAPTTIPLWSFDETEGIWIEDGSATKVGNKYVGNVSHFSWWNCDTPLDFCTLNAHVQNNAGNPIANIRIELVRQTLTNNYRSAITDGNGNATGLIPANETLTMNIRDNCGTLIYTSTIGPFASGSNNTLPVIIVNPVTITINGTLQACSGSNVTDGLVTLKRDYGTGYFYNYSVYNVTNGNFSFAISNCSTQAQFKIIGQDNTAMQISQEITFTATAPVTNLGFIQTCTSTNEYITFKIGSNPTKTIFTNINAGTQQGFYVNSQGTQLSFNFGINTLPTIGTIYTTPNFYTTFYDGIISGYAEGGSVNTLQAIVSQIGAIGGYIDFTINGTYNDQAGTTRTFTATGHVIRDN